jgi:hypothetical protein
MGKGEKRRNRISFVTPFYGFLRLFTPYGFKFYFRRFNRPQTTAGVQGRGVECGMEEERNMRFLIFDCRFLIRDGSETRHLVSYDFNGRIPWSLRDVTLKSA